MATAGPKGYPQNNAPIVATGVPGVGQVPIADGNGGSAWGNSPNPIAGYSVLDDFIGDGVAVAASVEGGGEFGLFDLSTGTLANVSTFVAPIDTSTLGMIKFSTGSTNAGDAYADSLKNAFVLGAIAETWTFRVYLANLSTGGERYTVRFGLGDGNPDPEVSGSNAIIFRYCDNVNSGKWQIITASAGVLSTQDSGVAAVAGSWVTFTFAVNASGTRVDFYINGVIVGNSTTHIFTGVPGLELFGSMIKSVGTTAREMYWDYVWLNVGATGR